MQRDAKGLADDGWLTPQHVLKFLDDELTAMSSVLFDILITQCVWVYELPDERVARLQSKLRDAVVVLVNQGLVDHVSGQVARRQVLVKAAPGDVQGRKFTAEYHGVHEHPIIPICLSRWLIQVQRTRWMDASVLDLTQQSSDRGHYFLWRVDFVRTRIDVYDLPPIMMEQTPELYLADVRQLLESDPVGFHKWCLDKGLTHFIRSEDAVQPVEDKPRSTR